MLKSIEKITTVDCKIFCNKIQYPFEIVNHGEHFDIYKNETMFFISIDTVVDCIDSNELSILWRNKPLIDSEIDDIEINYLYIDKNNLFKASRFYHIHSNDLVDPPKEFDNNYWNPGTQIDNPGIFYLDFNLPIESWCFKVC